MNEFEEYRRLLFSIAYRMTGSTMDAEDIVQDVYVRYQKVDRATIENPKAYLSAITTRLALNHLASAKVQRETYLGPWLPEPVTGADQPLLAAPSHKGGDFDSISIAFMILLENLTPPERAVFILREVFDYSYGEISEVLEKSESTCRKLYSRAKAYVTAHRPRFVAGPGEHLRLLEQFISATTNGDLDGLLNLLAEDAAMWVDSGGKARGAATQPLYGREAVAKFVLGVSARFMPPEPRISISKINNLPAVFVCDAAGKPVFIVSISVSAGNVDKVWVLANPDKLPGAAL